MATKLNQKFYLQYDLTKQVVKNLRRTTVVVCTLEIEGVCGFNPNEPEPDDRFPFEISTITKEGSDTNIHDVLENLDALGEIEEACLRHVAGMYRADNMASDYIDYEDLPKAVKPFNPSTAIVTVLEPLYNIIDSYKTGTV